MTLVVAIAMLVTSVHTAHAAEWSIEPVGVVTTSVDDNPRLATSGAKTVASAVVDVRLPLAYRNDSLTLVLTPRLRSAQYTGNQGLDHDDQQLDLLVEHQPNERLMLRLHAELIRDTTLTSELESIGQVLGRQRRHRTVLSPTLEYEISETSTLAVQLDQTRTTFSGESNLVDTTFTSAQTTISHQVSKRDEVFVVGNVSRLQADEIESQTNSISVVGGYRRNITEMLSVTGSAGFSRSEFDFLEVGQQRADSASGVLFSVAINKGYENGAAELSLARSLLPTSNGVLVSRDELSASGTMKLTPRVSGLLSLSAFQNSIQSERNGVQPERTFFRVQGGLRWHLSPELSLRGIYRYRRTQNDTSGQAADSNAVLFSLIYQNDKFALSR